MNEITQDAPDIVDVVKIDGEEYMRYKPIPLDYCIIRGTYVDENGNLSTEEEAMQLEVLSAVFACKKFGGNLFYVSGCGPVIDGPVTGRLGKEVTVEQGQVYARACMLNVLAALEKAVGDLRRVKSAVKITTFVQSADDFHEQPAVANGGTQLLLELWGEEAGLPSRSAIGVNALPGNIPVETEALFEVDTVSP